MGKQIMTVKGYINSQDLGLTLPHEHIMVDFIGADKISPDRYNRQEVAGVMLPFLEEARSHGVASFVECTPMYLARDPEVLLQLSQETGINILTNTGQYKEPFLPRDTFNIEPEELAEQWIKEARIGIDGAGIRPGFIKTAVGGSPLEPVQRKIIRAAAICCRETGLTIATHTGIASAASEVIDIIESEGVNPAKWIFVHAQNEDDMKSLIDIAARGSWISLDGLCEASADRHLNSLLCLLERNYQNQILLSHDAGWYHVGEDMGGTVVPFTFLFTDFIGLAMDSGIRLETIDQITSENPGHAYGMY
ncbi:MAG: phosphotriesterase [Spirochaetales bacterium]|mgnify:CR=1 FL=1|nr:phosphotriesterase [Spirochaetales bacterium]